MKTILLLLLAAALLTGCANPGPVHISGNLWMISRQSAAGGFTNIPKMKTDVLRQAHAFAASQGKIAETVSLTSDAHNFPTVTCEFRLVDTTNTVATTRQ